MNILRRLLSGDRPDSRAVPKRKTTEDLIRQIVEAPALFNRATRRSIGMYGRHWRWDLNASEETRRTYIPRYIRRHFRSAPPITRRQRRHRAVILRLVHRKGMA